MSGPDASSRDVPRAPDGRDENGATGVVLPHVTDPAHYRRLFRDDAVWLPAVETIRARHGLPAEAPVRIRAGSNIVFAAGDDLLIKLYAPDARPEWTADRLVLARVAGRLGVATPQVVASGELERATPAPGPATAAAAPDAGSSPDPRAAARLSHPGGAWPYLVVTRVPGVPLEEAFDGLARREQLAVMAGLGEVLARLHALPLDGLDALAVDWPAFVRLQAGRCVARHAHYGAPASWLAQLPAYLEGAAPLYPASMPPVLLSADATGEHVMLARGGRGWEVGGVIDFGDAMLGHAEYEFAAATSIVMHRPDLRRALLLAYGYAAPQLDARLGARLTAYTLLHRFASLAWLLKELRGEPSLATMADLEGALWRV
jgi:hygromycin-B 7''-O-kinase